MLLPFYGVSGKNLQHQYKDFLSDFKIWDQNTRKRMADFSRKYRQTFIDRRNFLSNGELYTILTNKAAKGKKGQ
jgi:hypothetical protein